MIDLLPRNIVIEVQGGAQRGMGHVSRSVTLARALTRRWGVQPIFLSNRDRVVTSWIRDRGYVCAELPPLNSDIWIVDVPMPDEKRQARMNVRGRADLVMALDYFHYSPPTPQLIVNLTNQGGRVPDERGFEYKEGIEFAIIRDDLRQRRSIHPAPRPSAQRLLIIFGGSDAAESTRQVLAGLADEQDTLPLDRIDVVLGPGFRGSHESVAATAPEQARIHCAPKDLAHLMSEADLAVCNGGTTMLELLHVGIPAVVVPATLEEKRFGRVPESHGAARLVTDGAPGRSCARTILASLHMSPEERRRMSDRARELVDGLGAERIASAALTAWRCWRESKFAG